MPATTSPAPRIRWYFDFISPFAYLQWPKVKAMIDAGIGVEPVPVVLGAILAARGQKGPAEIPVKREFTYRHALWQAAREGLPMKLPPAHPFNPLAALRACVAAGSTAAAVSATFDRIWKDGRAGDSLEALAPLLASLGVEPAALAADGVKRALRENTDAALAAGVYGVPTLAIDDALFWGNDAHAFALAFLDDRALLATGEMARAGHLPEAVRRAT